MRIFTYIISISICLFTTVYSNICSALEYADALQKYSSLKPLDQELNTVYQKIRNAYGIYSDYILIEDQKMWLKEIFVDYTNVKYRKEKIEEEYALEALRQRVQDLKKLLKHDGSGLFGTELHLGMTVDTARRIIAQDEKFIKDTNKNTININIFGNRSEIDVKTYSIRFDVSGNTNILENILRKSIGFNALLHATENEYKVEYLSSINFNLDDCNINYDILINGLSKKYKTVYYTDDLKDFCEKSLNVYGGFQRFYESDTKYILLNIDRGTLETHTDLVYIDKIAALKYILNKYNKELYRKKYYIKSEKAIDRIFVNTHLDYDLFRYLDFDFIEYNTTSECLNIGGYQFRQNMLVGFSFYDPDYSDGFSNLAKIYKNKFTEFKANSTIIDYLGYTSDVDRYFDCKKYYILIYFTPHVGMHYEIIQKHIANEIAKMHNRVYKKNEDEKEKNTEIDIDKI